MCVGLPLCIRAIDGIAATASNGEESELIDLSLTPEARPGDWVLTFLGAAREVRGADGTRPADTPRRARASTDARQSPRWIRSSR